MILDKIKDLIGKNNFFGINEFCDNLNLDHKDARELLAYGVQKGVIIETISDHEYGFSEYWKEEDYKDFSKFIDDNFVVGNIKPIRLDFDETELKDEVIQDLALRKKDQASESLVRYIEKNNHIYTTRDDQKSEMWIYQDGIYVPMGESFIKEYCRKILGGLYTSQFVNLVLDKIKTDTFIDQEKLFKQENPFEIPVKNGILNILTKKITIFNPRKIFFNKLPIVYDPTEKCPKIEEHFKSVLRNKEDAKVMFELFGYLLLKENKFEKAFMFLGNGRNGKSKTLELIKKFLGIENSSALPLSSMNSESFSLSELFGKMVNLAGDLSYTDLRETGILKQLIGRDEIQAKRKFLRDLNFVNYAKLIFACNELPKVYDLTDGFWTKWVLLEFPYKFISEKEYEKTLKDQRENKKIMDPDIIDHICSKEELSGLLNMALESLTNILEQKEFSYSKGTSEVKDVWIRQSDSFMAFCMDNLEEDYNHKISKKDLRKRYFNYCREYRLRSSSDKSIKITLENMFGCIEARAGASDGWFWEGIKFKECKECKGFSTYSQNGDLPLGSKTLTQVTHEEKKGENVELCKECKGFKEEEEKIEIIKIGDKEK